MRILLVGNAMDNFSGQPMSTYEMAKEFSKEHDVSVCVLPGRWSDNILKRNLEKLGVKCIYNPMPEYDLIIASEWMPNVSGFKINIVRSEYVWETPIVGCDFYTCIRPSIQDHIVEEHDIPKEKTMVLYNGVDRTRFKPQIKVPRDYELLIAPCTIDNLREKFLNHIIGTLNEKRVLHIYGEEKGADLIKSPYCRIFKPRFDMENVISQADVVVGILLGRVNLEANACGIKSVIYNPETLESEEFFLDDKTFDERHNIVNTCKNLLKIKYVEEEVYNTLVW